jgi:hypothetical protein
MADGGPLQRLSRAVGLPEHEYQIVWFGLGVALLAWLPLLVLNALTGTLTTGSAIPFLDSIGTHVRLLVAIPLFFSAELMFHRRTAHAIAAITDTHLVPPRELPAFNAVLARARKWRDGWAIEAILVVLIVVLLLEGVRTDLPRQVATWRTAADGRTSAAGWWYVAVSIPVFQFLVWRWCARFLVWSYVLWRINRLDLQLVPTHPDRAGGLGPLGVAHSALGPLNFAAAAVMAASFGEQILYGGMNVRQVVQPLAAMIAGITFILVAPLLLFMLRLMATKQRGLIEYGRLAADYTQRFDVKWIRTASIDKEALMGSADIQSLADLSNAFHVIEDMRIVPFAPRQLFLLVAAAAVPVTPLILFVVPLDELILRGARTLLNV